MPREADDEGAVMALLEAIRYHIHRLAKAESGRQEPDAHAEMLAEDEALEKRLARIERELERVAEIADQPDWRERR